MKGNSRDTILLGAFICKAPSFDDPLPLSLDPLLLRVGGQYLRVGKAITTADAIIGGAAQPLTSTAMTPMPTAAAVAAAAATAKIQAMETTEAPKVVVPKLGSPAVAVIPPPGL